MSVFQWRLPSALKQESVESKVGKASTSEMEMDINKLFRASALPSNSAAKVNHISTSSFYAKH
jgi:hypothetical protein